MTSRERVERALNHQPHDRIPVDLGGTLAAGLTVPAYVKLCRELGLPCSNANSSMLQGLPGGVLRISEPMQMLVDLEAPLRKALGVDTIGLYLDGGYLHGWQDWRMPDGTTVQMSGDLELRRRPDGGWDQCRAGKRLMTMSPDGYYFDPVEYAKWRQYDPAALTDAVLRDIETRARACFQETDLAVIVNVPYTIFNGTSPDFLCALLLEKEEVHARLEVWTDQVTTCLARLLDAVGPYAAALCFSGDAGSQKGPLIGPELYREMLLPHFRRIPEFVHRRSKVKFLYHTCGSVYRLMECFVELGVDALNPLQLSAADMEPERLVREFGGRLVFWGGGCDTQRVLPQGTEEGVRTEVRARLAAYGRVPGFVFAQVHNIQPDVPARNILAMLDEVRAWNLS